jgi:hypothetical protein
VAAAWSAASAAAWSAADANAAKAAKNEKINLYRKWFLEEVENAFSKA